MMNTQTEAQIYLADQRGRSETDFFRSYHTFNFGQYVAEGRAPFGPLHLLNDDTLRAGATLTLRVEQPMEVLLLPVSGGLEYKSDGATGGFVEPGQVQLLSLPAGMTYSVSNPYETESINFIQLWLATPAKDTSPTIRQNSFDLTTKNTLLPLFGRADGETHPNSAGFIGQYAGRQDDTYSVTAAADDQTKGIFVFVLQGAFEVANRLLHEKDGLALRYTQDDVLEFEAPSNDAIVLLIDLVMSN